MDDDFMNDLPVIVDEELDVVFEKLVPRVADKSPKREQQCIEPPPQQALVLRLQSNKTPKHEQNGNNNGQQLVLRLNSKTLNQEQNASNVQPLVLRLSSKTPKIEENGSSGQPLVLRLNSKTPKREQNDNDVQPFVSRLKSKVLIKREGDGGELLMRLKSNKPPTNRSRAAQLRTPKEEGEWSSSDNSSSNSDQSRRWGRDRSRSPLPPRRPNEDRAVPPLFYQPPVVHVPLVRSELDLPSPSVRRPTWKDRSRDERRSRSPHPHRASSSRPDYRRDDRNSRARDSPRRELRDNRAQSAFHHRADNGRSSARAQSVMHRADRRRSPSRRPSPPIHRDNNEDAASIIGGSFVRGEVQVLNNPVFPKREKKEDGGDADAEDDLRIVMDTRRSRSPSRRRDHRSLSRTPFGSIEAYIKKRQGDDNDPVTFDWDNPRTALKDERVTIHVFSDMEKACFRVVMLDPTYGTYPLEANRVLRNETGSRAVKIYEYEFTPIMYGPHIVLLTMDDYFRIHAIRVQGTGPPPQRRHNDNRPRLQRLGVSGVSDEVRQLFHAPRPRRDGEKFVDPRRVLEGLLG